MTGRRKLTLGEENSPAAPAGDLEPETFPSWVRRSNHWAKPPPPPSPNSPKKYPKLWSSFATLWFNDVTNIDGVLMCDSHCAVDETVNIQQRRKITRIEYIQKLPYCSDNDSSSEQYVPSLGWWNFQAGLNFTSLLAVGNTVLNFLLFPSVLGQ